MSSVLRDRGRPSLALMPPPGASPNTTGNIRLPSASATPSRSHAALTSRTPLVSDSGLAVLLPTCRQSTSGEPMVPMVKNVEEAQELPVNPTRGRHGIRQKGV